jgi:hypothetical protein
MTETTGSERGSAGSFGEAFLSGRASVKTSSVDQKGISRNNLV